MSKVKSYVISLPVLCLISVSVASSESTKPTGIFPLETGITDIDMHEVRDFIAWFSDDVPKNSFISCISDLEYRVCGFIIGADLRSFYPIQENSELYQGLDIQYYFNFSLDSGSQYELNYSYNTELPDIFSTLIDEHSGQISHISEQLLVLGAPPISAQSLGDEPTHVYHLEQSEVQQDINILRSVLCEDFDYYFRTSLDGNRMLLTRHTSIERLANSISRCVD